MQINRVKSLSLSALAVCVCAATLFQATEALAQVRPAVTKNVDEPGRSPFQHFIFVAKGGPGCGSNYCIVTLPPVPAGKRLVITGISGVIQLEPGANVENLALFQGGAGSPRFTVPLVQAQYYTCTLCGPIPRRFVFNESLTLYVEAGQAPFVNFHVAGGSLADAWPNEILVTGYFVDLTI